MSGSFNLSLFYQAPSTNLSCGFCNSECVELQPKGWQGISCQVSLRRPFRGSHRTLSIVRLSKNVKLLQGGGKFQIRALRTDEEKRRFRGPPDYPPTGPSGSLNSDLDDDLELPMLRGSNRRDARVDDGGYPPRKGGPFGRTGEDYNERPLSLQPFGGINNYILAGMFVLGIGAGITADTVLNVEPNNVASREVIDRQTPNPDVCIANGMSAMVLDQRLFISFNPFNVYVSQTEVKPGCVLRQSNWNVLESRGLVTSDEVRACKRNMNTFGFVGDLRQAPEISCVYHSESAENQFLKDPSKATMGDGFQPKDFEEK